MKNILLIVLASLLLIGCGSTSNLTTDEGTSVLSFSPVVMNKNGYNDIIVENNALFLSGVSFNIQEVQGVTFNTYINNIAYVQGTDYFTAGANTLNVVARDIATSQSITLDLAFEILTTENIAQHIPAGQYLYIVNELGNDIVKVDASGAVSSIGSGLSGPSGIAFHPTSNNMYISDDTPGIYVVEQNGTDTTLNYNGMGNPNYLEFEGAESILIADAGATLNRLSLDGAHEIIANNLGAPQAVAVYNNKIYFTDSAGYIYVVDQGASGNVAQQDLSTLLDEVVVAGTDGGIDIDSVGNIYVADNNGKVKRININNGSIETLFFAPLLKTRGVRLTPSGTHLLVTTYSSNLILAFNLSDDSTKIVMQNSLNGPFGIKYSTANIADFTVNN